MMQSNEKWVLSQTLQSDGSGVRCVGVYQSPPPSSPTTTTTSSSTDPEVLPTTTAAVTAVSSESTSNCGDGVVDSDSCNVRLVIGSQNGGLTEFVLPTGATQLIAYQHNHSVTAILFSPKHGYYVTGSKDCIVRILDATTHTVRHEIRNQHTGPVTSLAWADPTKQEYFITGSWDGTAKIFRYIPTTATTTSMTDNESVVLIATLSGHENSVCVTGIPMLATDTTTTTPSTIRVATGSTGIATNNKVQDHTLRIWEIDCQTRNVQLLHSVANDHEGPIRDVVCTMLMSQSNEKQRLSEFLVTCSNDGSVKLRNINTGICEMTLLPSLLLQQQHPPMLLSLSISDQLLVASAEDGNVIVWECTNKSYATYMEPQILQHPACVWRTTILPNGDIATCCDDGTVRVWTQSMDRMADTNEIASLQELLHAKELARTNGPSLEQVSKLPYWARNSELRGKSEGQVQLFQKDNKAIAAQWSDASQTWIEVGEVMGDLPNQGVIEGVAYDHVFPIELDRPDGSVATLQIGYNNGENPFDAAKRFIDAHVLPQHHLAEIADYIQKRAGQAPPTLGMTAPSSPGTNVTPMTTYEYLPARSYKVFELVDKNATITLEKMKSKMEEFGASKMVLDSISSLLETLMVSNRYHASHITDTELDAIKSELDRVKDDQSFPILDVTRLTVLHPDAATSPRVRYWASVLQRVTELCQSSYQSNPTAVPTPMLSLRLFANACKGGPGSREAVVLQLEHILMCTTQHVKSPNKNIRLSVATLLLNISYLMHHSSHSKVRIDSDLMICKMVGILDDIITTPLYESESLFRSLVALGTIVMTSSVAKHEAQARCLAIKVEPAASPHPDHVKVLAREVYSVLQ